MLVTAVAAIALALQNPAGLDTPVSIEFHNNSVPSIMAELEKQSGMKIHVQGAPLYDVVFAKIDKRPLRSTLDVLAKLCDAKWAVSQDQVYFSAPWPPSDQESQRSRVETIAKWLQDNPVPPSITKVVADKIIDESLEIQNSQLPNAYQKSTSLYQKTPMPRAHLRLLHGLGAKELASIEDGESRVYMFQGRGRIAQLPPSAPGIFEDLVSEREFYSQLLKSRGVGSEEFEGGMWLPSIMNYSYIQEESTWVLIVHNESYGLTSELRGFSGSGGEDGRQMVTNDNMSIAQNFTIPEAGTEDSFAEFTQPYATPEEFKSLVTMKTGAMPFLSEPLKARFLNMGQDEVLTDFVYDAFLKAGEAKKADVVALIPDAGFFATLMTTQQSLNLGSILRYAMLGQGKAEMADGALMVRPLDVVNSRLSRIPRPQTSAYLRSVAANGEADLDSLADLAIACESDMALMMAASLASIIGEDNNSLGGDMNVIKLYGHLNPTQRKMAKTKGLTLSYSSLNAPQKRILEKLLFGRNAGISPKEVENDIETSTGGGWQLDDMPQLKFPDGIPPQSSVTFRMENRNKLFGKMEMEGGYQYVSEANVDSLAWSQAYQEAGFDGFMGDMKGFTYADRTYLQVSIDFGPLGFFSQSLPIGGPKKDAKYLSLSELPKEFQEEYAKKLKEYTEQVKQMGPPPAGGNGGRRPPPP